jgi:hypothetical protein
MAKFISILLLNELHHIYFVIDISFSNIFIDGIQNK